VSRQNIKKKKKVSASSPKARAMRAREGRKEKESGKIGTPNKIRQPHVVFLLFSLSKKVRSFRCPNLFAKVF